MGRWVDCRIGRQEGGCWPTAPTPRGAQKREVRVSVRRRTGRSRVEDPGTSACHTGYQLVFQPHLFPRDKLSLRGIAGRSRAPHLLSTLLGGGRSGKGRVKGAPGGEPQGTRPAPSSPTRKTRRLHAGPAQAVPCLEPACPRRARCDRTSGEAR